MTHSHALLRRQLRRIGISPDAPPTMEAWTALLARVAKTYGEADNDRYTLERSLSTSSAELQGLYEDLRATSETELAAERTKLQFTAATVTATLEAAPDGILVVDQHKKVVAYNRRFSELWQIPPEVLAAQDDDRLLGCLLSSLSDPGEFLTRVRHLYEHPLELSDEEVVLIDGRVLDRHSAPVLSPMGDYWGRVWFFRDISARKRAEEELRRANLFLDSIVENIPDMIFVKDAETLSFERFNRAGEELLGVSRDALIGTTDRDHFPKEQADWFEADDRATLAGGTVVEVAEEPVATARGTRWLHTKKIPIFDEHGKPKHLLGISADITDRKLAQEILRRSNEELERLVAERTVELQKSEERLRLAQKMEAIGRLAGGVAHDFNNMLAVVVTCSQMLLDEVPADSPLREDLDEIRKAAQRAAALTRQLLAFSRQQILEPRVIDLNAIVADMEKMLSRVIGEDIRCVTRLEDGAGCIEADPSQIQQVILNLAVNARDAMPRGGVLVIETAALDFEETGASTGAPTGRRPHVSLTVRDSGCGMDDETRARIFEPFFTTKARGQGTGLGLATVYGIVQQSGGQIRVESEPGEGTTLRVFFPRVDGAPVEARPAEPAAEQQRGSETILLVEDEDMVRASVGRILRKSGYHVIDASSGGEALALAEASTDKIHLLLTDVIMPGMNGYDLATRLVPVLADLRVVYMSGYTDNTIAQQAALESGSGFLQKPFAPRLLLEKIRELLDTRPSRDPRRGRAAGDSMAAP